MPTKGAGSRQTQILVVEDNPIDTLLTLEAFKAAGMTSGLHSVKNGKEALAYMRREGRYRDAPVPDLIFLDLSQPRVSGLAVLRVLKRTPELMHIPIVVAAGLENPRFVRAVYALNGNCFIRKPAELTQFLRFIEACQAFWGSVVTFSPKNAEKTLQALVKKRPAAVRKKAKAPPTAVRAKHSGRK